jgi:FkbM family methyltransferase
LDWFAANVLDGETWIDVGAHYGYTAIALSQQVGVQGRVFAFEPVLSTAACISQTQRLNDFSQMTIVPLGLDASHNIRVVDLPAVRGMADSTIGHSHEHEKILVGSLDHLWPSLCNGDGRIHGVKIDVQGMEADVLKGMRQTLLRCAPKLVVEFHRGVDRFHLLDLLKECGYASTAEPIDQESAPDVLADDHSYAFFPLRAECAFLSTPSSIARS